MLIGYARVSKIEQHEELQIDALKKKGCTKIFVDKITGSTFDRKELNEALNFIREGDSLVVWRLDRLGRSLKHLIETLTDLEQKHIGFISLTENIDTTTPTGKLIFHIFGALAEFERDLIRERTKAGLDAARARGKVGGRKKVLTPAKLAHLKKLHADKSNSIDYICELLGISRTTLYRSLKGEGAGG